MVEKSNWGMATWIVLDSELESVHKLLLASIADFKPEPLNPEQAVNQPFDNFFACSICLQVVAPDMHECATCDKLNCKTCIDDWMKKQSNCPTCRADITPSGKPNRFVMNVLNEMVFACTKCPETYKYADRIKHLKNCS